MLPLSIAIFGNTNNYPLLLAQGLKSLGHNVRLVLNRKYVLHRPEAIYPKWSNAYPEWVCDCSDITDEDIACAMPAVDEVLRLLTEDVDLVLLNDTGPALARYLNCPYAVILTGSDLSFNASFDSLGYRTQSWSPEYKRSAQGRKLLRCLIDLISQQRDGILGATVVCYAHRGLIPGGDQLLDAIGVTDEQRMMLHMSNIHNLSARRPTANEKIRVLCGSRIVYRAESNPELSAIDFKGADILIRGFAEYCQRGGKGELCLPQKGQDLEAARDLIKDLGIGNRIVWLPEMPLSEFYDEMIKADLICDQFGSSFPGMVTTDSYALSRPVMANLRSEIFDNELSRRLPGFDVKSPSEIADCLLQVESNRSLLEQMGREGREYAEKYLSPEVLAAELLQRCGLILQDGSGGYQNPERLKENLTQHEALVNFASIVKLTEGYKKNLASQELIASSLEQLSATIETSVALYEERLNALSFIDSILTTNQGLGFGQKLWRKARLLLGHSSLLSQLHLISHDMAHRFDELSKYTLAQLKLTLELNESTVERHLEVEDWKTGKDKNENKNSVSKAFNA